MIYKFNKNIYDDELVATPSGSSVGYNYSLSIDKEGEIYLEKEAFDQQAVIDSYADSCSIERILVSHGLGDELVMNQKPGVYLDEDDVKAVKLGSDSQALNMKLYEMYQNYKGELDFSTFADAILSGNYEALNKKESKEEVTE